MTSRTAKPAIPAKTAIAKKLPKKVAEPSKPSRQARALPVSPPAEKAKPPAPVPAPPVAPPSRFRSGAEGRYSHSSRPSIGDPNLPPVVFKIGDKAVHPAHGLGEVTGIEKRDLAGSLTELYVLRIFANGLKVMVPITAVTQVGLRGVMSAAEADRVLETMRAREVAVDLHPWSKRFRAYTEMVQTGLPLEIAKVMRDMARLKFEKELSFGERRLLDQAKSLLFKELALAKTMPEADLVAEISAIFSA